MPQIERDYVIPGRVFFAFRNLPIEALHPQAFRAAQWATCGQRQGVFWTLHDALFKQQDRLDDAGILVTVQNLAMDGSKIAQCVAANETSANIREEMRSAETMGLRGTPTIFIGTMDARGDMIVSARIGGSRPIAEFTAALDRALQIHASTSRPVGSQTP